MSCRPLIVACAGGLESLLLQWVPKHHSHFDKAPTNFSIGDAVRAKKPFYYISHKELMVVLVYNTKGNWDIALPVPKALVHFQLVLFAHLKLQVVYHF